MEESTENTDLFEHYAFDVEKGQSLLRIDKYLTTKIEKTSRNRIQNAALADSILVNGTAVKSNYRVKPFDKISIVLPYPPYEFQLLPENIPLNIVFEDEEIMIINKPAGMVVHPGHGNYNGTLVNAILYHLKDQKGYETGELRAGLVHRIDKDTSGLLVIAKTEYAHNFLAKQFFDHTIERKYMALVWGCPKEKEGTITGNIGRHLSDRLKMSVFADGEHGKEAVTHYKVIENLGYISLLECKLETGRTHQIRVHLSYIGHPIFGDERYGGTQILKGTTHPQYRQFVKNCFEILPRQGLHAKTLGFQHPSSKQTLFFDSVLPDDILKIIDVWKKYTKV